MKLLFPNGEHGPVELKEGTTRVGSGAGADVTIVAPGVAMQHCEVELRNEQAVVRVADPANVVVVNGKQVSGEAPLKAGDLVLFSKVGARVVAVERPAAAAPKARADTAEADDGRTKIRMALPRFVLRGVSGSTFGKTFPLFGTMTVGRHSDCDVSIPSEEISRHHAKLQVLPDGVAVEDLGSANGTFINGKRVHQGMLKPGEELRLDTVRFLLVAPGMEAQAAQAKPAAAAAPGAKPAAPASGKTPSWVWLVVGMVGAGAVIAGLVLGGVI
jgi:pSer/pThr/pTyr-binding forkhead associated (FHA) protein